MSLTTALTIAGCQDGYPIDATPCDRYCTLGLAKGCGDDSPAGCVLTCEVYWGWTRSGCTAEFDDWVRCLKAHEYHLVCDYSFPSPTEGCESTQQALDACMRAHFISRPPTSGQ